MTDLVMVKPWPGLILAEVPAKGAALPKALAEEWIDNHLVVRVAEPAPKPARNKPRERRASPRGSGATRPKKQRRTQ